MPSSISTRSFAPADYDPVVRLWEQTEGVEVAEGDDRATVMAYLTRNPGLSRVAVQNEQIIGAVLCGHDGRRGLLYHLAVAPGLRGQGIGRRLVEECLAGLQTSGIKRALILVARENDLGRAFWAARGFADISGAVPYGIDL